MKNFIIAGLISAVFSFCFCVCAEPPAGSVNSVSPEIQKNQTNSFKIQKVTDEPKTPKFYYVFNSADHFYYYVWLDEGQRFVIFLTKSIFSPADYRYKPAVPVDEKMIDKLEIGGRIFSEPRPAAK